MGNQQLTSCISGTVSTRSIDEHIPCTPDTPSSLTHSTDHFEQAYCYKRNIKLLFLDVDGVLNRYHDYHHIVGNKYGIEHQLLSLLRMIVVMSNCKIVLSTSWRLHRRAKRILIHSIHTELKLNVDDLIIGQTPNLKQCGKHRSDEIECFLNSNADRFHVVSWCAIDDISLDKYDDHAEKLMHGHFVKTDPMIGISSANVENAVNILNSNLLQSE